MAVDNVATNKKTVSEAVADLSHTVATDAPKREINPALRLLGLPAWRPKLPSWPWLLFLTVSGGLTASILYDRQQKQEVQRKWCRLVSHVAAEALAPNVNARKVTVYLAAPPGDGLRAAREYFHEYIKPVLMAGGLDWDAVEGRREGDVRAGLSRRIRELRASQGEGPAREQKPAEPGTDEMQKAFRAHTGVRDWDGVAGDIVIGRHTWKEYVRGLHEGWLGPADGDSSPAGDLHAPAATAAPAPIENATSDLLGQDNSSSSQDKTELDQTGEVVAGAEAEAAAAAAAKEKDKPAVPRPLILVSQYPQATEPPTIPAELAPSVAIPFPHILGFLKTHIRIYRFLTRRYLADEVGRQVASAVLAAYQPYGHQQAHDAVRVGNANGSSGAGDIFVGEADAWEQRTALSHEEPDWPKHAVERKSDEERVWLDEVAMDRRIAQRMRKFVLDETALRQSRQEADDISASN